MNKRARDLGCTGTNFVNAHGLHDANQVTTARDMARIAMKILECDEYKDIFGAAYYTVPETNTSAARHLVTVNYMVDEEYRFSFYYSKVTGGRTGVTEYDERCLVVTAEDENSSFVGVILGAEAAFDKKDPEQIIRHGSFEDMDKLLGFENATVSYTSSNEKAVKFTTEGGKTVMECLNAGKATVTVTATYNGKTATETIEIEVITPDVLDAGNVQNAIQSEVGDTVTVKGIVGPSLVNRNGFYLIDESGLIAVVVNDVAIFAEVEIGQEIIIKGKRDKFHNNQGGTHAGQTAITDATVIANYYGQHDYDTSHFVTDKTLADFYGLDVTVDYSTTVFVVKAIVNFEETAYYTKCNLTDGTNNITLYCSSAKQYSFLKQFAGQEVTLELAACNWNNKTFWAGCVLSVLTEDGKVINSLNFDNN